MPVMDGIEAVSRYREFERKARSVVVLLLILVNGIRYWYCLFGWSVYFCNPLVFISLSKHQHHHHHREVIALTTPEVTLRKQLPIIGMSANSDNATKLLALNAGMDLFIPKPFILSELEPLINQLLHRKSSKDSGIEVENSSAPTRAELEPIGDDKVYLR